MLSAGSIEGFEPFAGEHEQIIPAALPNALASNGRLIGAIASPAFDRQSTDAAAAAETIGFDLNAQGLVAASSLGDLIACDSPPRFAFAAEATGIAAAAPFPLAETFALHSNPGATKVIYLDFNGHTTTGEFWNTDFTSGNPIVTPAFSIEGDSSFSNAELERIQRVWERTSEDFLPFDVDVTTEDPGIEGLESSA